MKLYHYVHCPFCLRVRFALGFLQLPFESVVLPYEEEELLIKLTGKKMLPIMEIENDNINESLHIIKKLDKDKALFRNISPNELEEIENILTNLATEIHSLAMPYWMWTPEFNKASRKYFQNKKEVKRGPFSELVNKSPELMISLSKKLSTIFDNKLQKYFESDILTIKDILIASHLWGLYIVPEFQFDKALHDYLQRIKAECDFNYHKDFWN